LQRLQRPVPVAVVQPASGHFDLVMSDPRRWQRPQVSGRVDLIGALHRQCSVSQIGCRHCMHRDVRWPELHSVMVGALAHQAGDLPSLSQVHVRVTAAAGPRGVPGLLAAGQATVAPAGTAPPRPLPHTVKGQPGFGKATSNSSP